MAKGSGFEREFCKQLSRWWTDGERTDIFWRSTTSGARATVRAQKGLTTANSCGDICAIDPIGHDLIELISIELKRGYSGTLTLQDMIDSSQKEPSLLKFWKQAERDRRVGKRKYSWLIFKRDRRKACIVFGREFWELLMNTVGYATGYLVCGVSTPGVRLYIMRLDEFLDWIDPEIFYQEGK